MIIGQLVLIRFVNLIVSVRLVKDMSYLFQRERNWFIEQLQKVALAQRLRISFLSGDVHCAAVGVFKTLKPKNGMELDPPSDYRYMVQIVTSAIVNTPP